LTSSFLEVIPFIYFFFGALTVGIHYLIGYRVKNESLKDFNIVSFFIALGVSLWLFGNGLQFIFSSYSTKYLFHLVENLGILLFSSCWLIYAVCHTIRRIWIDPFYIVAAVFFSCSFLIMTATNSNHNLVYTSVTYEGQSLELQRDYNILFIVFIAYMVGHLLTGAILIIRVSLKQRPAFLSQSRLISLAIIIACIGPLIDFFIKPRVLEHFKITSILFSIDSLLITMTMPRIHGSNLLKVSQEAILNNLTDSIIVAARTEKILYENSSVSQIPGKHPEKLAGHNMKEVLPEIASLGVQKNSAESTLTRHELTYSNPKRIYEVNINTVLDWNREILCSIYALRDISAQKELEDKLLKKNEDLKQFAYAVSHDLNEPLRIINSYIELLGLRYRENFDAEGLRYFSLVQNNTHKIKKLLDGLLQYTRLETRAFTPSVQDLNDIVGKEAEALRHKYSDAIPHIEVKNLPTVMGDSEQLSLLFHHLMDNGILYNENRPPKILVSFKEANGSTVINVDDNGIGIDRIHHARIFEIFQRLHSSNDYPGTGIGLALCKRIAENHGWDLIIDSEHGHGCRFSIFIPRRMVNQRSYYGS
jgi:PAS domain S-box-containing protein